MNRQAGKGAAFKLGEDAENLCQSLEHQGLKQCSTCGGKTFQIRAVWIMTVDLEKRTYDVKREDEEWAEVRCLKCSAQRGYFIPEVRLN